MTDPPLRRDHHAVAPAGTKSIAFFARLLAPVRVRLAGLILVAAVPLMLLAGTIAWQNYSLALGVSAQRVAQLRESAVARHEAAIDGAEQMLVALGQSPELIGPNLARCHQLLADVWVLQQARYSNISLFDATGHLHCLANGLPGDVSASDVEKRNQPLFASARASGGVTLGPVRQSRSAHGLVIPAVLPVRQAGMLAGYLSTGLRMDWFTGTQGGAMPALTAVWLVDATGRVTPVVSTDAAGLPHPAEQVRLLDNAQVLQTKSMNGKSYAYASAPLGEGYRMLVAYPADADEQAAGAVLAKRALQLAVFLLLGLAGVALGTHRALVAPLNDLNRAVLGWRETGQFDASSVVSPPLEVQGLIASFGEAAAGLAAQRAALAAAVEKQDLLMKEIHHRVKNNLQIVASLLNLQAARIRVPAARAEFAAARDRVRALATLHRHLYSQGELTTIAMRQFLTELCGQLFDAMGEREGGRIALTIEAVELDMTGDQAVPLSLVVTEAVSNSVKYAFPGGRRGHVEVYLTREGNAARLTIRDDGVGIPAGRAETETGTRDGLGLQLIKGFSKQLGATLTVREENGTCYELVIPLQATSVGDLGAV